MLNWATDGRRVLTGNLEGEVALWDAHVLSWIDVLTKAEALGADVVVPGHGAPGPGSLVGGQRAYFVALRDATKALTRWPLSPHPYVALAHITTGVEPRHLLRVARLLRRGMV